MIYYFTQRQRQTACLLLSLFHIITIITSNYLVQIPVFILGFTTTWGAFTFPFIFLATDLTVRIFGAILARKIIFIVMIPALIISYTLSTLFFDATWQGISALQSFNLTVARIALASFMAYTFGQLIDVFVFDRLRQYYQWWLAPAAAMFVGNFIDTLVFFSIAFHRSSDAFMAEHWIEIALLDYLVKLLVCLLFFLPAYGIILHRLLKKLATLHSADIYSKPLNKPS